MHVPGEDLLQYLIVPPDSSSQPSKTLQPADSDSPTQYRKRRGQLSEESSEEMEIENPTSAQLPCAHTAEDQPTATAATNNATRSSVFSLEEYMAQHPAPTPPSQATPLPRAISARSSKYTIELHEKYQAFDIPRPEFVFTGGTETGWGVKTDFYGELLEEKGPFLSKQEAKEKLSERALGVLERLEAEGKIAKKGKSKKKKKGAEDVALPVQQVEKEKEPGVNFVGQLLEFQRSTGAPQPTYQDYQLGTRFSCLLTIEGHPEPFGSTSAFFTSKKAARQDAARYAVEHFKAAGQWPDSATDVGGIKKKKAFPSNTSALSADSADSPSGGSYASQVAQLAAQLSLPPPLWSFSTASSAAPGFHTVSCYFQNGGAHEGPIGEVRNIFGKKKAKEGCAQLTLQYLLAVKERRMSYGKRVMDGIVGSDDVASVAVGGPIGGNKEIEGDVLAASQVREEMGGSESDEEFEDAEEELGKGDV